MSDSSRLVYSKIESGLADWGIRTIEALSCINSFMLTLWHHNWPLFLQSSNDGVLQSISTHHYTAAGVMQTSFEMPGLTRTEHSKHVFILG